jgi:hypothetical protein
MVAEAHSGPDAIGIAISDAYSAINYESDSVHLQFLAAVLRLADEIDEDHRRAAPYEHPDLKVVPADSRRFWFFSRSNASIKVVGEAAANGYDMWIDVSSKIENKDELFSRKRKKIRALTEYLARIMKMEQERRYCNQYIRKAYYHPGLCGIRVTLELSKGNLVKFVLTDAKTVDEITRDRNYRMLWPHLAEAREW